MTESQIVSQEGRKWNRVLNELEALYKQVDRATDRVSIFTLKPWVLGIRGYFYFFIEFCKDIFLWVPINVTNLIRHIFLGKRRRHHSFSGRYWQYWFDWICRGEAPFLPSVVVKPLVDSFVNDHVYRRWEQVKRQINLDLDLDDEDDRRFLKQRVKTILEELERPTLVQIFFFYVLPLIAATLTFLQLIQQLIQGQIVVILSLMLSPLTWVITAFMMKRSLMLGATDDKAIYFPGEIPGAKYYDRERRLLEEVGISSHEFPLDILLVIVNFLLACLLMPFFQPMIHTGFGGQEPQPQQILIYLQQILIYFVGLLLAVFALLRRKKLKRW